MAKFMTYRTGHGRFPSYFVRFNVNTEDPECPCGAKDEPEHLVQCTRRYMGANSLPRH